MTFNGAFATPIVFHGTPPIPVAGGGALVMQPGGLEVRGYRPRSRTSQLWPHVLFAAIVSAILGALGLHVAASSGLATTSVFIALFTRRTPGTQRFAGTYAWRDVKRATVDRRVVVLEVRGAGMLHFEPVDGPDALLEILDVARGKRRCDEVTLIAA